MAQDWFDKRAKKTSGQKNLTIELCKSLPVPIPSKEEQKVISNTLLGIEIHLTNKNSKLAQTQALKKSLMQDLLTGKKRLQVN